MKRAKDGTVVHVQPPRVLRSASSSPSVLVRTKSANASWAKHPRNRYRVIPVLRKGSLNHSFHKPMRGRDPKELHRKSTSLEKLYDLTLVVALSSVSHVFAKSMEYGDSIFRNCVQFVMLFFTIWNAWLPFIWFSSSYDVDDVLYRIGTLGQMIGILVVADGIQNNLSEVLVGYVILRLFLEVFLRGRAAYQDPEHRGINVKCSAASLLLLVGWGVLFHSDMSDLVFQVCYVLLGLLEFGVPMVIIATSPVQHRYHAHHISERYSEFTIIVFGECLLSLSRATVIESTFFNYRSLATLIFSMILLFMLWWFYFLMPFGYVMDADPSTAFRIGRGHFFIHGSLAAFATGLFMVARCANTVDPLTTTDTVLHGTNATTDQVMSTQTASMMIAVPIAAFLVSLPAVIGLPPVAYLKVGVVGLVQVVLGLFVTSHVPLEVMLFLYCIPVCTLLVSVIWQGGIDEETKTMVSTIEHNMSRRSRLSG